jgi:hypothetical protein
VPIAVISLALDVSDGRHSNQKNKQGSHCPFRILTGARRSERSTALLCSLFF